MTRNEIFSALGLEDIGSGAFAGEWLDGSGPDLEVENPATAAKIATGRTAHTSAKRELSHAYE